MHPHKSTPAMPKAGPHHAVLAAAWRRRCARPFNQACMARPAQNQPVGDPFGRTFRAIGPKRDPRLQRGRVAARPLTLPSTCMAAPFYSHAQARNFSRPSRTRIPVRLLHQHGVPEVTDQRPVSGIERASELKASLAVLRISGDRRSTTCLTSCVSSSRPQAYRS
jgi:hypothetical protein